ncbi:MFS transporter [Pseudonocardia hydrocarbonoxydans]
MDPVHDRRRSGRADGGTAPVIRVLGQYRSFPRSVQLLLLNQLTINLGFYMLIPYLAAHLSDGLGLATWLVGLVLGVRNFAQQGMFLVGGALADRFGYKPLIVAGCALRTVGFALLGVVDSLPALIVASAATGFAGALFNPAVRAYLAQDAGERRVEAFALFSVFYQAGILLGPLIGLALTGVSFSLTCLVSAGVFALLTVLQIRALPSSGGAADGSPGRDSAGWRDIVGNRPFLLFAAAMAGSYVLSFQVYLALPLQAATVTATAAQSTVLVAVLFAVSGLVTILGQLRVTAWCRERLGPARSMVLGLVTLGAAFLPPLATAALPAGGGVLGAAALVLSAGVLALGTAILFPFEMSTIVALSGNQRVATHYGLYNTVCGVGILLGNLGTGWALDLARSSGVPVAPWLVLIVVGTGCAAAVRSLRRRGLLPVEEERRPRGGRHRLRRPVGRPVATPAGRAPVRQIPSPARTPVVAGRPAARMQQRFGPDERTMLIPAYAPRTRPGPSWGAATVARGGR